MARFRCTPPRIAAALTALFPVLAAVVPVADAQAHADAQRLQAPACESWTGDYALAARLRLTDTPFGAGNGTYDIGPGHLRLRVSKTADPAVSKVELLAYDMQERFTVESSVLFIHATVDTRTETRATPDARGVAATGTLRGSQIAWSTPVGGYRTDGTIHCAGSGCGFSGVPPKGTTELHIAPHPVKFGAFVFDSPGLDTLHMAPTKVAHTEMPQQTAYVTFAGRRMTIQCSGKE